MTNRKSKKNIILMIALAVSLVSLAGILAVLHFGSVREAPSQENTEAAEAEPKAEDADADEPSDILFFASDYQIRPEWDAPSETLAAILQKVKEDGKTPTNAVYCGDYTNDDRLHDYQLSPEDNISEIRGITTEIFGNISHDDMIFVQGNHDKLTESISETGLHEYDGYLVYVLNTEYDFPWKQGRSTEFKSRVIAASEEMRDCFDELIKKGEKRPVFIAGHVPLHFTARTSSMHDTGDNMYAEYIFDAVNEAAGTLDIVYLFGHNHTKGWDCYMGGGSVFKTAGDTVLIPDAGNRTVNTDTYSEEILNFTYMNAGYVGHYLNCGADEVNNGTSDQYHAADETLTGTICEIYQDEMVITRYSKEGVHRLSGAGEGDPYKGGIDAGLIGSQHYSSEKTSPAHINRKRS